METSTRLSTTTVHDLFFVDDCAPKTTIEEDTQRITGLFAAVRANSRLTIKMDKTVVLHQPPPDAAYSVPRIPVNGTERKTVDNFVYSGSTLSHCSKIDDEVAHRISKASQAFDRLQNSIWNRNSLQPKYQAKDAQSCHFDDTAVWCGNLDSLQEAGAKAEPLPSQLSSTNTKAKGAGQDPWHGSSVADRDPQHLRHAGATATTMERPPREDGQRSPTKATLLCRYCFGCSPAGRPFPLLQGNLTEFLEATADQPGDLGGPRPRKTSRKK
ncbi:hypothetical protein SprV_0100047500 [Sparganum proliferum]